MIVEQGVDVQALNLQGEWHKLAILSLIYESMGYNVRSIWS